MLYINKYQTSGDIQTALNDGSLIKPYLALINNQSIDYNTLEPAAPSAPNYLKFVIEGDGNICWGFNDYWQMEALSGCTIEYSKDNGNTWTSIIATEVTQNIPVVSGDTVLFRGLNHTYHYKYGANEWEAVDCSFVNSTAQFSLEGNIMSLIYGDDFEDKTVLPQGTNYTFSKLFTSCTGLTSAENLEIPATSIVDDCYESMFENCTSLTKAPSILPATTLTKYCYNAMFYGCTSLTTAPILPATTLTERSYSYMFSGCTNLSYIKCLATNLSASLCTDGWVIGVSSTGTFVKASGITWPTGNNGIPSGWTVIQE